jgi:predicted amino acid racemase
VDPKYLIPSDDKYEILGGSSDMLIINLGENPNNYQVGDTLNFDMKYMGALSLLNSSYIDKKVID